MNLTKEALRARFAEIGAEIAEIEAVSVPLRAQRDELVASIRQQEATLNEQIVAAEAGLFELKQEYAMIVRALAGKTSDPEAPQS